MWSFVLKSILPYRRSLVKGLCGKWWGAFRDIAVGNVLPAASPVPSPPLPRTEARVRASAVDEAEAGEKGVLEKKRGRGRPRKDPPQRTQKKAKPVTLQAQWLAPAPSNPKASSNPPFPLSLPPPLPSSASGGGLAPMAPADLFAAGRPVIKSDWVPPAFKPVPIKRVEQPGSYGTKSCQTPLLLPLHVYYVVS